MNKIQLEKHLKLLKNDYKELNTFNFENDFLIYLSDLKAITYCYLEHKKINPNIYLESLFAFYLESSIRLMSDSIPSVGYFYEITAKVGSPRLNKGTPLQFISINKNKIQKLGIDNHIRNLLLRHSSGIIKTIFNVNSKKDIYVSLYKELTRAPKKEEILISPEEILKKFHEEIS